MSVTRLLGLVLILIAWAAPVCAQEHNALAWSHGRTVADTISTIAVWSQIGAEVIADLRAPNRKQALGCDALRMGLVIGAAEVTKRLVHRTRPDGSDRYSFYSEHTALAWVNTGWRFQVSIPFAIGTGYLRPAANRHYATDVLVGAAAGFASRYVCSIKR